MSAKRGIVGKKGQEQIRRLIMSGKWGRIDQTLMKTTTKITRLTLKRSPQGKRKRGRHGWVDLTSGEGWTWLEEEYVQLN